MNVSFDHFKQILLGEVYELKNTETTAPEAVDQDPSIKKIKWILVNHIEKSKDHEELKQSIHSALFQIDNVFAKAIPNFTLLHGYLSKIQEKVSLQINGIQKPATPGRDALITLASRLDEVNKFDLGPAEERIPLLDQSTIITPIEKERSARLRRAVKETYCYSLVMAEKHQADSFSLKRWNALLTEVHEKTFKDFSYEIHYLDLKSGNVIKKDVVDHRHRHINAYKFRTFKDYDNNAIIPLVIYQPKQSAKNHKTPVAIYTHGGPAQTIHPGHRNPQFCALAQLGYTIIVPNYRGSSLRTEFQALLPGHEDQLPFEDMQATLNYIKTRDDLNSTKVLLAGISYGTYLNALMIDRLGNRFAGVFLHTGIFGEGFPSPFDHVPGIPSNLPIFFVSGAKDSKHCNLEWAIKYRRAVEDVCLDFTACLLSKGGHHLISLVNPEISQYGLLKGKTNIDHLIAHTAKRYNSEEFMDYICQLVEFFDRIATGQKPVQHIVYEGKAEAPTSNGIVAKIKTVQSVKALKHVEPLIHISKQLLESLWSPSLAHMMIATGEDHPSIDPLVSKFLNHYDSVKPAIRDSFLSVCDFEQDVWQKAVSTPCANDAGLHTLICSILKKELEFKGSYVLYHGANPRARFIYNIYSTLHRLINIEVGGDSQTRVKRLRALDDAFTKIRTVLELISKTKHEELKDENELFNYLPGYQEVGISAQWFLFGSYKYWYNSTFFRYFREGCSIYVDIRKILTPLFQAFGITDETQLDALLRIFFKVYNEFVDKDDGSLLQIFVSPEIIDEVAYVSEAGGSPLELQMDADSPPTSAPSKILPLLMRDPKAFEALLKSNRDKFKHQKSGMQSEFTEEKPGLAYINSVEARFFMYPENMNDGEKIRIFNYHSRPPKPGYDQALEEACMEFLAALFEIKPKLGPGMTWRRPPAITLQHYIHRGVRGFSSCKKAYTLYDLLSAGKWVEAEVWIQANPKDLHAKVDPQGHNLLFQLLRDNKYIAAQRLLGMAGGQKNKMVNAKDSKRFPIIYDLLLEGNFDAAAFLIQHGANLRLTANAQSMALELLSKGKFDAAKFLAGANVSEFTQDRELIKWVMMGNMSAAKRRAEKLLGIRAADIDSNIDLSNLLKSDLDEEGQKKAKKLIDQEYNITELFMLQDKSIKEGNITAAKLLIESGLPFEFRIKRRLLTEYLEKEWTDKDREMAEFICQLGFDVNYLYDSDDSIIVKLVESKKWDKIKWLQEHGLKVIISEGKISSKPFVSYEDSTKAITQLIVKEQWDKIEKHPSIKFPVLPDNICYDILEIAQQENWPIEKVCKIMEKLLELGANPFLREIYSHILKHFKGDHVFKLASLLIRKKVCLYNRPCWPPMLDRYPIEFLIWYGQQDLNERQKYFLQLAFIKNCDFYKTKRISEFFASAQTKWGINFIAEIFYTSLKDSWSALIFKQILNNFDPVEQKNLREKVLLKLVMLDEINYIKKDCYAHLNFSENLRDKIISGDFQNAKLSAQMDRTTGNQLFWDALTAADDFDWKSRAETALKSNPHRDLINGNEQEKHSCLLYILMEQGKLDRAQWLIDNGANVNALQRPFEDKNPKWPLLYCVMVSEHFTGFADRFKYYDFLIDNGADIECFISMTGLEDRPLLRALLDSTDLSLAEYLIGKGANVNVVFGENRYPILLDLLTTLESKWFASDCGLLIKHGARINARTEEDGLLLLTTLLEEELVEAAIYLAEQGGKIDPQDLQIKTSSNVTIEDFVKSTQNETLKKSCLLQE